MQVRETRSGRGVMSDLHKLPMLCQPRGKFVKREVGEA